MKTSLTNWTYPQRRELMRYSGTGRWDVPTGMFVDTWGGWEWEATDGNRYRTDSEGAGLWIWRAYDWKQIAGTMQFSLSQDRTKALRQLRATSYRAK